jgi:light-regulated signal transduction histidine kinase (bacteriophytochrome)/CheY-like chemotaxis protein
MSDSKHADYLLAQPVDLTSCDMERIHEIGSIQAAGFLLTIDLDWIVTRVSANCPEYLGQPVDQILGENLGTLILPDAIHAIRNRLSSLQGVDAVERAFAVRLQVDGPKFDLAVHRTGNLIMIEAEASESPGDLNAGAMVRSMIDRVQNELSVSTLTEQAVRLVQALTGYDRVMIYLFHPDGSGEVIAERARDGMEPFLGLRYPASDIPKQARALLARNPVRILFDRDGPISPVLSIESADENPLDMSMSTLRAHSTIHLEYLRNMGVGASLTISLLKNGLLWGLISCHHNTPRSIGFERRTTAELFAQVLSLLIDRCERNEVLKYEAQARELTGILLATITQRGIANQDFIELANHLMDVVPCDGSGFVIDGKVTLKGITPTPEEFGYLHAFLDGVADSQVYCTDEIGKVYPAGKAFVARASGMLAIPISTVPRDYLVFFRKETASHVTWAGDPNKPVLPTGPNGTRLTPRKSFEAWQATVSGKSKPWTDAEKRAADALKVTVLAVVLRLISSTEAERALTAQKQELLVAELNHRVRNILGLIRGLISQSRVNAQDVETFATVLGDRVHALARAHDQITAKNWGPGSFQTLIATESGAYLGDANTIIRMSGPPVLLVPQAFSTMALVIHELITNAAKYGSLKGQNGYVDVDWTLSPNGNLIMTWREVGGPAVEPRAKSGFGSTIIERSIPHELGGLSIIEFLPAGVEARFEVPAQFVVVVEEVKNQEAAQLTKPRTGRLSGFVLLVEDNMIIALDAETMLLELGAQKVVVASNVRDAFELLDQETPSFALLDVNLGSQNSFPVADRLQAAGVKYLFATGYGSGVKYPPTQVGKPFITKPYTQESIATALGSFEAQTFEFASSGP